MVANKTPNYSDVIMGAMAPQITSLPTVYLTVYSGADQKHPSSASLAFVRGIHRWPVNSPHKWPVTRKMFLLHDAITRYGYTSVFHSTLNIRSYWSRYGRVFGGKITLSEWYPCLVPIDSCLYPLVLIALVHNHIHCSVWGVFMH